MAADGLRLGSGSSLPPSVHLVLRQSTNYTTEILMFKFHVRRLLFSTTQNVSVSSYLTTNLHVIVQKLYKKKKQTYLCCVSSTLQPSLLSTYTD